MKRYFIQEHFHRKVFHGGIGNIDAERIFLQKGFIPVFFPCHYNFSLKAKLVRLFFLIKTICTLPKNSCIIFQFPLHARLNKLLVTLLGYRRSIRIICFIADIEGFRDGDTVLLQKEINELRRYRYFIAHNETMKQWLLSIRNSAYITLVDFFDFLTLPVTVSREKSCTIVFAGNLEKSKFLENMGELNATSPYLEFNIYGKDPTALLLAQVNVNYKGFAEPYSLPEKLQGSFGLVWDGNDINYPGGSLGSYLKYNSPHKLSLYILSGLPIITWAQAASAPLVKKYNIGIVINSLFEIEHAINAITEETYMEMIANTKKLALQIANGERLGNAIDELLRYENDNGLIR
jgi:hypothetical protein